MFTKDPVHGPGETQTETPLCPLETPLAPGPTIPFKPASANIFQPIATGSPPQSLPFRGGHYVKKEHIVDRDVPIQTNKFYANFFLGTQGNPVWTHPYHLIWAKGIGETRSYGMAISHTERSQFAYGPPEAGNKPRYFISPVGIHHMVLSAEELGSNTVLSVEELRGFSVYANFAPSADAPVVMTMPVVQGMGLVTAIYKDARPITRSGVFFRSFDFIEKLSPGTFKWRVTLNDNSVWMFYVTSIGSAGIPPFVLVDSSTIAGGFNRVTLSAQTSPQFVKVFAFAPNNIRSFHCDPAPQDPHSSLTVYCHHASPRPYVITMGASNLLPLVILFAVVGGVAWVGYQVSQQSHLHPRLPGAYPLTSYQIFLYTNELAERGVHKLEKKNVVFTKDGAKVGLSGIMCMPSMNSGLPPKYVVWSILFSNRIPVTLFCRKDGGWFWLSSVIKK
jgi:hypothetical protein